MERNHPTDPEGDGNPAARAVHSLTYDAVFRGVVVLFGGHESHVNRLSDTWEYDGISWKEITPTDPEGDGNPSARRGHSLTYDAARGVVVLFGGRKVMTISCPTPGNMMVTAGQKSRLPTPKVMAILQVVYSPMMPLAVS